MAIIKVSWRGYHDLRAEPHVVLGEIVV